MNYWIYKYWEYSNNGIHISAKESFLRIWQKLMKTLTCVSYVTRYIRNIFIASTKLLFSSITKGLYYFWKLLPLVKAFERSWCQPSKGILISKLSSFSLLFHFWLGTLRSPALRKSKLQSITASCLPLPRKHSCEENDCKSRQIGKDLIYVANRN